MKKGLLITLIIILLIFLWSPWLGDFYFNIAPKQQAELDAASEAHACREGAIDEDCCDGLSSKWAPFGRKVTYCSYESWYVPFWGNWK